MEIKVIPISKIKPSEYNPRTISKEDYEALKKNIETFGLVRPLVINKDYTLIGGHQTLKAILELGYKEVDVVFVELSKDKEKTLNISLNRIEGDWDYDKLKNILDNLDHVELTGFTTQEVNEITTKFDFTKESKELNSLLKEEKDFEEFTAKVKKGKTFEKILEVIKRIRKKKGWDRFSNDYCNGLVLKELCERYGQK